MEIFYFLIFVQETRIFPSKRILVSKNIFKRDVSQAIFQDVSQSFDVGDIEIFLNGGKQTTRETSNEILFLLYRVISVL